MSTAGTAVKMVTIEADVINILMTAARAELDDVMACSAADPQAQDAHEWADTLQRAMVKAGQAVRS